MITKVLEDWQTKDIMDLLLKIQSYISTISDNLPADVYAEHGIDQLIAQYLSQNQDLLCQLNKANSAILDKALDINHINNSKKAAINFYKEEQVIIGKVLNVISYMLLSSVPVLQARYDMHQKILSQVSENCKACILSIKAGMPFVPWAISLRLHPDISYLEIGEMFETEDSGLQAVLKRLSGTDDPSGMFIFLRAPDIMNQAYKILNTISAALLLKILARTHPNIMQIKAYISGFTGNPERDCDIAFLDNLQNSPVYANNNALHCRTYTIASDDKMLISFSAQDVAQNINALFSTNINLKSFAKDPAQGTLQVQKPKFRTTIQPIECLMNKPQTQDQSSGRAAIKAVAQDAHQARSPDNSTATRNTFQTTNLPGSAPIMNQPLPGKHAGLPATPTHSLSSELQNKQNTASTVYAPKNPNTVICSDCSNAVPVAKASVNQSPDKIDNCQTYSASANKPPGNFGQSLIGKVKTAANAVVNKGQNVAKKFNNFFDKNVVNMQDKKSKPSLSKPLPQNTCNTQPAHELHTFVELTPEQQQIHYCYHHKPTLQHPKTTSIMPVQENPALLNTDTPPTKDIVNTPKTVTQNTPTTKPLKAEFRNCIYGNSLIGLIKQYFWTFLTKIFSLLRLSRTEKYCENNFLLQNAKNATMQKPEAQATETENNKTITTLLTSAQASSPNTPTKPQNESSHINSTIGHRPSTAATNSNGTKAIFASNKDLYTETSEPTTIGRAQAITNTVIRALG